MHVNEILIQLAIQAKKICLFAMCANGRTNKQFLFLEIRFTVRKTSTFALFALRRSVLADTAHIPFFPFCWDAAPAAISPAGQFPSSGEVSSWQQHERNQRTTIGHWAILIMCLTQLPSYIRLYKCFIDKKIWSV